MGTIRFFIRGVRILLCGLIAIILLSLIGGMIKTFLDLQLLLKESVEVSLRQIVIDVLILLAVVEVCKTTLTYLARGRVKVTYVVDTVLVVMLSEVIAIWFKGSRPDQYLSIALLLGTLGAIRICAIRFSPRKRNWRPPIFPVLPKPEI